MEIININAERQNRAKLYDSVQRESNYTMAQLERDLNNYEAFSGIPALFSNQAESRYAIRPSIFDNGSIVEESIV